MNVPKTGGTKKFEAKISIVKVPAGIRQRLDILISEGNSEADIVRAALDMYLPKKKATKENAS